LLLNSETSHSRPCKKCTGTQYNRVQHNTVQHNEIRCWGLHFCSAFMISWCTSN
jgi:hypothetical protein